MSRDRGKFIVQWLPTWLIVGGCNKPLKLEATSERSGCALAARRPTLSVALTPSSLSDRRCRSSNEPTGTNVAPRFKDETCCPAETKDHLNWEVIGLAAKKVKGDTGKKALKEAYEKVR